MTVKTAESYSVTINLPHVRNTEDMMLQLVWLMRNIDREQVPIERNANRAVVPLFRKGCLRFGTLAVSRNG